MLEPHQIEAWKLGTIAFVAWFGLLFSLQCLFFLWYHLKKQRLGRPPISPETQAWCRVNGPKLKRAGRWV